MSWGIGAGVVTSIPLGPTGALVLSSASRDDRKGIYFAVLGLACAQLVFQTIYHLGFSKLLTENHNIVQMIGVCGIVMTLVFGIMHVFKAKKISDSEPRQNLQETTPKLSNEVSSLEPRSSQFFFFKALTAGLFNPFLLFYIIANVSMFAATFPDYKNRSYIAVLLLGGLTGTVLWYLFFGEMIRRHSFGWGKRGRIIAELASGILMFAAGTFLLLRL
jgi:threonine/homoserine/homoserine lactone efflux protein